MEKTLKWILSNLLILAFWCSPVFAKNRITKKRHIASEYTEVNVKEKAKSFDMGCNEGFSLEVEKITHRFRYDYDSAKDPERESTYFIATCPAGALNKASILFYVDENTGLQAIALATPVMGEESKILGWRGNIVVDGLTYDPALDMLVSRSKTRNAGDMGIVATYAFLDNDVVLKRYEYDNTPNGKFDPKVVYEVSVPSSK